MRLTVGQALVRFLTVQYSERDGVRRPFFAGCWGIFGHGNVAGLSQALLEAGDSFRYYQGRNEQAMVHAAAGYARMTNRLQTFACTSSIGPGATNMVTGAALATINRLPVLLLPGDVFATRVANPVLQELEDPRTLDVSVNDCLRPVSRYFDRIWRPEQLPGALMQAMRVLTDPAETGAVTLALPQDTATEAYDWPPELLLKRVWRIPRPYPEPQAVAQGADAIRGSKHPLIVAGGGVHYSDATAALRTFAELTGVPVAETQAGKGALRYDHPAALGAIGATGTVAANSTAAEADLVIGVGTRWSDFTTASSSLFACPGVRFVNLNVAAFDAHKQSALPLVADARVGLEQLAEALSGWQVPDGYRELARQRAAEWDAVVERAYHLGHQPLPAQSEVIGALNEAIRPQDVVVCAAGSMPGDLHKLWRTRDSKGYHVEYGFSCMGYEIAGGLGVKMAAPGRDVYVLVGDGSYLMLNSELVTSVQEGIKIVVILVQNHGFQSIGGLSRSVGAEGFGTRYRYRSRESGQLDGDVLPVDLAANAASLGAHAIRVSSIAELRAALDTAQSSDRTTVIHIETDPTVPAPDSAAWWDVPVAEVSELAAARAARADYEQNKKKQLSTLGSAEST
ncbi:MAG TPA: 3D-(3,5/4)-trihydroxycyclohexane-1,2-dione acylhydrolase (decyclizing) [Streptosporangiaceae bacterium]|nr:3D-(3,5/4)-trihydroxycyclohexane-1,2-dione acylhydrolase (decyclizing) [Streptosporangiaceae bacterium]